MACTLQVPQQTLGLAPPSLPTLPPAIHTTIVPFTDYSQWERRPQKPLEAVTVKSPPQGKSKAKSRTLFTPTTSPSARKTASTRRSSYPIEDTVIVRSRPVDDKKKAGSGKAKQESIARMRLLRMQVATKRVSVEDVRHYKEELFLKNLSLMRHIHGAEHSLHSDVDKMLDKYTKFKGAISRLKTKGSEDIEQAREELEITRAKLDKDVSELRQTVIAKERMVQKRSQELDVLLNYKEKEYPLKTVKIDQLKEQCEIMIEKNDSELAELEVQIAEEWDKCDQTMNALKRDLETKATRASIVVMKRSLHEKAIQNSIMEKEIVIHQNKYDELQEEIAELKSKIKRLSDHVEKRTESRHRSPLAKLGKCLPNTEFQLDFPRQQQFPL